MLGLNLCFLHGQVDSLSLVPPGKLYRVVEVGGLNLII